MNISHTFRRLADVWTVCLVAMLTASLGIINVLSASTLSVQKHLRALSKR